MAGCRTPRGLRRRPGAPGSDDGSGLSGVVGKSGSVHVDVLEHGLQERVRLILGRSRART